MESFVRLLILVGLFILAIPLTYVVFGFIVYILRLFNLI